MQFFVIRCYICVLSFVQPNIFFNNITSDLLGSWPWRNSYRRGMDTVTWVQILDKSTCI